MFLVNTFVKSEENMKKYSKWKDEEVKKLFRFIEQGKQKNQNLSGMFSLYAKLTNRKPNSVRNYYYTELNELETNQKRREKLNIDISLHQKTEQKEFSKEETEKLTLDILKLTSKGLSVRKACLQLADNNVSAMVRLQNKFRSVVLKDKELYESCLSKLKLEKPIKQTKPNNVISFVNPKSILTESDINSLFLGLVKLVQKQTEEKVIRENNITQQKANDLLKKMIVKINEKEKEIKRLQQLFKVENLQNKKLNEQIRELRVQNTEILQNKNLSLKKFTQSFEKKDVEKLT